MKRFFLAAGMVVLAAAVVMLGGGEVYAAPASSSMPTQISVTSGGGLGTTVYAIAAGMAQPMEKAFAAQVRVTPLEVVRDRYKGMMEGSVHLNLAATGNAALAMEGAEAFGDEGWGPKPFRHIWRFYDQHWGYMVRRESDIKSIYDIKGRKVAIGMHSSGCITAVDALLAFVNLKKEDVKLVPVGSWAALQRTISEGKAEVTFAAAEGAVAYEVEASPSGLRFLDMPFKDKEAWARFLKISPASAPVTVSKGVKSAHGAQGYSSAYSWMVYADANEEYVYRLAKFAGENYEDYKKVHKALETVEATKPGQRAYLDTCGFVVHPGAIRYYKEIGMWTAKDEKRNQELLALEKDYQKAWKTALDEAKAKNIKVSVKNKAWMDLWDGHRNKLTRFGIRMD